MERFERVFGAFIGCVTICWNEVRMCFEWRLKWGVVEGRKLPDFGFGVTIGVTVRGYIFHKLGLHIRGFGGG